MLPQSPIPVISLRNLHYNRQHHVFPFTQCQDAPQNHSQSEISNTMQVRQCTSTTEVNPMLDMISKRKIFDRSFPTIECTGTTFFLLKRRSYYLLCRVFVFPWQSAQKKQNFFAVFTSPDAAYGARQQHKAQSWSVEPVDKHKASRLFDLLQRVEVPKPRRNRRPPTGPAATRNAGPPSPSPPRGKLIGRPASRALLTIHLPPG